LLVTTAFSTLPLVPNEAAETQRCDHPARTARYVRHGSLRSRFHRLLAGLARSNGPRNSVLRYSSSRRFAPRSPRSALLLAGR